MTDTSTIAVIISHRRGQVLPETDDLLAFARILARIHGGRIGLWMIGDAIEPAARKIARETGLDLTAVCCPGSPDYSAELYVNTLADEFRKMRPVTICAAHTSQGWDFVPGLAEKLAAACITGVNGLGTDDGRLCFYRDLYGGKVQAKMISQAPTTVLTVLPGVFEPGRTRPGPPGEVVVKTRPCRPDDSQPLGMIGISADADIVAISEADVLVAAGAGMGSKDNMQMLHDLARLFPRAAVAGSRIVCERGWLKYHQQVGMTGTTVAPRLYIACGISGAAQHIIGMRGAGFVIAINTDPQAPIFNHADVCIVEDVRQFIPLLLEAAAELNLSAPENKLE